MIAEYIIGVWGSKPVTRMILCDDCKQEIIETNVLPIDMSQVRIVVHIPCDKCKRKNKQVDHGVIK